jgi:hypothetical protein
MFQLFKALIPQPHATMDDERRYNIGLTWIDRDGLTDRHNIQIKYIRNSEKLAITMGDPQPDGSWIRNSEKLAITMGDPQPDGSWKYIDEGGMVHTMSVERVNAFYKKTQENAIMMSGMIDKIKEQQGLTLDGDLVAE